MDVIKLKIDGLEEIQNQIKLLASKIDAIQNQSTTTRWVSNSEACALLGFTTRTLQNYRDSGMISFSKVGSRIFYKVSDLENFLISHYYPAYSERRGV